MSFELLLGVIGSVTGVLALIIQLFDFRSYIPKLKIRADQKTSYVFSKDDVKLPRYKTDKFCIVNLQINNVSAMPTTITSVTLNNPNKYEIPLPHDPKLSINDPMIPIIDGGYIVIKIPSTQELPIRVNAYDAIYCSFRFPFMPESNTVTVRLETPTRNYSLKVALTEFHTVRDRYRSQQL